MLVSCLGDGAFALRLSVFPASFQSIAARADELEVRHQRRVLALSGPYPSWWGVRVVCSLVRGLSRAADSGGVSFDGRSRGPRVDPDVPCYNLFILKGPPLHCLAM